MNDYTLVTDAITRMNLISGKEYSRPHNSVHLFNSAPLAIPENVDLGSDYAQVNITFLYCFRNKYLYIFYYLQVKDVLNNYPFDGNYAYAMVQDNVTALNKLKHRTEKERPSMSLFLFNLIKYNV